MTPEYYRALVNDILNTVRQPALSENVVAQPEPALCVTVTVIVDGRPVTIRVDQAKSVCANV